MSILDMRNNTVYSSEEVVGFNGTFVFTYKIGADQRPGDYLIKITPTSYCPFISQEDFVSYRRFKIEKITQMHQFVTVDFERQNYSPGEKVQAKIKIKTQGNEPIPDGSFIEFFVDFPDSKIMQQASGRRTLDEFGESVLDFQIPSDTEMETLTVSLKTYQGEAAPLESNHTVNMIDLDNYHVKFFSEFKAQDEQLKPLVPNKVYF